MREHQASAAFLRERQRVVDGARAVAGEVDSTEDGLEHRALGVPERGAARNRQDRTGRLPQHTLRHRSEQEVLEAMTADTA